MPREHRDHVGDDEGCRRPGHQEEGDEGHSPEEAQHRGERALRSTSGPRSRLAAGCLEAVATTQTAKARRRRDGGGSETARTGPAPEGGKRSEVRGRRVDRQPGGWGASERSPACCETGEVTKRQPGPPEPERAATSPPTPGHAGQLGFLSLLLGTGSGGCSGRRGIPRGRPALAQVRWVGWIPSSSSPRGFPLSLSPAPTGVPSSVWPPMPTPSGLSVTAGVQAEGGSVTFARSLSVDVAHAWVVPTWKQKPHNSQA